MNPYPAGTLEAMRFIISLLSFAMFANSAALSQVVRRGDINQPKGIAWSPSKPESDGVDTSAIEALYAEITEDQHHDLKGIVILRNGHLVSERYFNGDGASTLHDIRSATKSITALLMGIAIQRGLVHSVNDSIALYLPDLPADGKEKITIKDLLNMRSGLDADDDDPKTPGDEDNLDKSADWLKTIYSVPIKEPAGRTYNYASINAFLTGAIIENTSHMPLDRFADSNFFRPLGIDQETWRHVPVNRVTGQGNLSITTRDLAAIGELVLNGGRAEGKQIVPEAWIAQCTAKQVVSSAHDPYSDYYGYMWYTKAEPVGHSTVEVHFASGNGGNKAYVIPSLHMVVAITSSAYSTNYGQRRSQNILLKILSATHDR